MIMRKRVDVWIYASHRGTFSVVQLFAVCCGTATLFRSAPALRIPVGDRVHVSSSHCDFARLRSRHHSTYQRFLSIPSDDSFTMGPPNAADKNPALVASALTQRGLGAPNSNVGNVSNLDNLPPAFRYYRPTADGSMNVNRYFLRHTICAYAWNAFLANLLTEVAAAHPEDIHCMGRFLYVPWRDAGKGGGATLYPLEAVGPQLVFVPFVHTPREAEAWLQLPPTQRDLDLNVVFAVDIPDDQPVLPIYVPPTADLLPRTTNGTACPSTPYACVADTDAPGLFLHTIFGIHHLFTIREGFNGGLRTRSGGSGRQSRTYSVKRDPNKNVGLDESAFGQNTAFMHNHEVTGPDPQLELLRRIVKFYREHGREHAIPFHQARSYSWHT